MQRAAHKKRGKGKYKTFSNDVNNETLFAVIVVLVVV